MWHKDETKSVSGSTDVTVFVSNNVVSVLYVTGTKKVQFPCLYIVAINCYFRA